MGSLDDFESSDDVYDAIGDILQSVSTEKTEDNIRHLCSQFFKIMKVKSKNVEQKVLNGPINIAEMARSMELKDKDIQSIWVVNKDSTNNVGFIFIILK